MRSKNITKSNCRRMSSNNKNDCVNMLNVEFIFVYRKLCDSCVSFARWTPSNQIGSACACLPIQCTYELKIQQKTERKKKKPNERKTTNVKTVCMRANVYMLWLCSRKRRSLLGSVSLFFHVRYAAKPKRHSHTPRKREQK